MGFTIHTTLYIKENSKASEEDALHIAEKIKRKYILLPGSEPLTSITNNQDKKDELPGTSIPGYKKVVWFFSKIQFSINPSLSMTLYLCLLKQVANSIGDDYRILYSDDDEDDSDPRERSFWVNSICIVIAILQTPIYLMFYLWLFVVNLFSRN